jgi:asparagine N-glycosylation enzyme membrane subunit Stt3
VLAVGLGLRLAVWQRAAGSGDGADAYGLSTLDGFYYARLARAPVPPRLDPLRAHPHGLPVPPLRPLLPTLAAAGVALGLPEAAVWRWLPAALGAGVALPTGLLAAHLGGPLAGMAAAAVAAVHPALLQRTALGRFDTDGLILLAFALGTLGFACGRRGGFALAATALLLGLWSWDQAPEVVLAVFFLLAVLSPAALSGARKAWSRHPRLLLAAGAVAAGALAFVFYPHLAYFLKGGQYGELARSLSEQTPLTFTQWVSVQGGPLTGLAAVAGGVCLFRRRDPRALTLLPLLMLGGLGAFTAARLAFFAAVPLAVCVGVALAAALARWPVRSGTVRVALAWLAAVPALPAAWRSPWRSVSFPESARVLSAWAERSAPGEAVHAWWDSGYIVQLLAGRPTLADGGHRTPDWLRGFAAALSARDDRAAHAGLRALGDARGLFLDPHTLRAFPWLLRFAAPPSPRPGGEAFFRPFFQVRASAEGRVTGSDGLDVRIQGWRPEAAGQILLSPQPRLRVGAETLARPDLVLVANLPRGIAVLLDQALLDTLLVRLVYLETADPALFPPGPREGPSGLWPIGRP